MNTKFAEDLYGLIFVCEFNYFFLSFRKPVFGNGGGEHTTFYKIM